MHILLVKQEDKTGVVCIGYLDLRYFGFAVGMIFSMLIEYVLCGMHYYYVFNSWI